MTAILNVQRVNDIGISFVGLYPRDLGLVEERTDRWAQTGPPECQNVWWEQPHVIGIIYSL